MDGPLAAGVVAVILKGYPRLSETFIAQELHALEQRGIPLALYSLRHPTDEATHPVHAQIEAPLVYLPEYLHRELGRVWRAWRQARRLPRYRAARTVWWRDLMRDPTRSRVRRFGQALVLAVELPRDVMHLHAHFLHTPASVARYAAILRGLAFSFSAHAKDIWTTPEWEKREKLDASAWVTTCTEVNARHLRQLARDSTRVELNYHGIDTRRFPSPRTAHRGHDGTDPSRAVAILTVGRAVEKKGFDDLLRALALLPRERHWRLTHIGGGPLLGTLKKTARDLGIGERADWLGPQAQTAVLDAYRAADIFALPCRVGADGDRDGLPNVLLEAQSQKLACVSTRLSGIPELIENDVTGLLVDAGAADQLADALSRLIADPALRRRLGDAGYARTTGEFSMDAGADRLATRLKACLAAA
ncbi:MAG: glycosyltransferase family 4 protein [Betaproteobacteria bacterium]|nr:glycosyltransferase family 4 protein [Betaproteobacteria bacterium]